MLGSRVDRTELDDKSVTDDPVSERFLRDIGPVPCEMDGFTVAGIDARLLGARKRAWQMFHGVSLDDLPEEISLPRRERSSCNADFLVIRPLPASVGKNVAQRCLRQARALLQVRGKIAVKPPRQGLLRFQRDQTGMLSGYYPVGIGGERGWGHRDDAAVAHGNRQAEMMAFKSKSPFAGFGGCSKHSEGEALRRTRTGPIALRCKHILKRHDIFRLLKASRRQDASKQVPSGLLLRRTHLL